MGLNAFQLEKYASCLQERIKGEYLSKAVMIEESAFSFSLSRSGHLLIVLDANDPFVYLSSEPLGVTSLNHPLASFFRKEFSHAQILDVHTEKEDRILYFELEIVDDIFQKARRTLVIELIPHRPNLLVLDEKGKILITRRYGSLSDPRPILKGLVYEAPEKKGDLSKLSHDFSYEAFLSSCLEKETSLKDKRKHTRFKDLLSEAQNKIKASDRKIKAIKKDIEQAKLHLKDGQYGTYIYTFLPSIHPEAKEMDYYGEIIPLDPRKSAIENAESFFLRAKKAKVAVTKGQENLERALNEKEKYETLLEAILSSEESALESLAKEYGIDKSNALLKSPLTEKGCLPYALTYQGVTYLFGRNAIQNDYLSFLYATKKDRLWFHVKDQRGAHLILQKDHPTNEEIQHACEFALLASKLESGEVQYTEHKFVKRGSVKGQAVLKTYQSALIREIPEEIKEAFLQAKKAKLK